MTIDIQRSGIERSTPNETILLPKDVPEKFVAQAKLAITYFNQLEGGKPNSDNQQFAQTVAMSGFVGSLKSRDSDLYDSSFPPWLKNLRTAEVSGRMQTIKPEIATMYDEWVAVRGGTARKDVQGEYVDFAKDTPPQSQTAITAFKAYMPTSKTSDELESILSGLADAKLHPHTMKLATQANRLVMYYQTTAREEVVDKLHELGVQEIKQDSIRIREDEGRVTIRVPASADVALSTAYNLSFTQDQYDPQIFLKTYLRQCYYWYRNPADPNWLSFIPSDIPDEELPSQHLTEAKTIDTPIIYIPPRTLNI